MRLIDADALKEVLHGTMDWCDLIEVDKAIRDAPTIDPVRHGKWYNPNPPGRSDGIMCSLCGYDSIGLYNYCPNCGARMDGGTEDDG